MIRGLWGLLCFCAAATLAAGAGAADFHVAANGRDSWSGRLRAPNARGTDGPFATIARARQAVRALKQTSRGRHAPIVVEIHAGTYYLDAPLAFAPEDSGTSAAPIIYTAAPGESVVVSGGRRITGWRQTGQGWSAQLPDVAGGSWNFAQLFVADQRRPRPRLPKNGYFRVARTLPPSAAAAGKGYDRFGFAEGDIRSGWSNLDDVEVLAFQVWTMARLRVASVDDAARTVAFTGNTRGTASYSALPKGNRYIVENVKEALSEPGEWYLDRKAGELTYLPKPGETPEKTVAVAPRLPQLVLFQGNPAAGKWVDHIEMRGITFAHTNWVSPPEGNAYPQAEVNLNAAIQGVGARDCALVRCAVRHVGGYAVEWGEGCHRDRVEQCALTDLGAGGVKIGETNTRPDADRTASENVVRDCVIAQGGRLHPAAVGVWIGLSPANVVEHNEIADFYYTGISMGWTWGYGATPARDNRIAYNHIHNLGQGVLSDMGGIYTLGLSPGSVLSHNHIHDVQSYDYGGWGIYFDEGTTNILARDNVVYRTRTGGFHQHYGKDNHVENNVFALASTAGQLIRTRPEEHRSFVLQHNIVYWNGETPLLGSNWSGNNYELDYNLYWSTDRKPIQFAGKDLSAWRAQGQDVHSIIADPLFVNPAAGDFRLKPGSPAGRIGFQPIDLSTVGPRDEMRKRIPPAAPRAFPPPPAAAPPSPISEDFETTPVGEAAPDAQLYEENGTATIRVTEETAATGRHSLKFVDAPGQRASYNPHTFYQPGFGAGIVTGSFDLRIEPGARLAHEWRDKASPYHVGPSIRVAGDGTLTASGRTVTRLPLSQWVHIELKCGLGNQADGTYELTVRLPGRVPPIHITALPCSKEMRTLDWYGFSSEATEQAVFYVDNVEVRGKG